MSYAKSPGREEGPDQGWGSSQQLLAWR